MKKHIALILVITLLAAMLVSCKKAEVEPETDLITNIEVDETMAPEANDDQTPSEKPPLPDFGKKPEFPEKERPAELPADGSRPNIPSEMPEFPAASEHPEAPDFSEPPVTPAVPAIPEAPAEPEVPTGVPMDLSSIIDAMYQINDPILPAVSIPVDLADEYSLSSFTGLTDASLIEEAVASESMMGAQAYSLVLVRVKNAADAASVAQAMRSGIDQRKWICVMADDIRVVAAGDVVMLCMIASDLDIKVDSMVDAFSSVVGLPFTTDIR